MHHNYLQMIHHVFDNIKVNCISTVNDKTAIIVKHSHLTQVEIVLTLIFVLL